jgi:hypothetical protein
MALVDSDAVTEVTMADCHGMTRVDLLSLDVEGYENNALRGLDLDSACPEFILVEAWQPEVTRALLSSRYAEVGLLSSRDLLFRARRPAPRR